MTRLFVYGSLQPGAPNEHVLGGINGKWCPATVRGRLVESGWGAALGYPGLLLDEQGDEVSGSLLTSPELDALWESLDTLEGEEYERTTTAVVLQNGDSVDACIYVLKA